MRISARTSTLGTSKVKRTLYQLDFSGTTELVMISYDAREVDELGWVQQFLNTFDVSKRPV